MNTIMPQEQINSLDIKWTTTVMGQEGTCAEHPGLVFRRNSADEILIDAALLGGEVVLDALINTDGRIAELNVVHGTAPFLEPVLNAVRTWTFSPAQMDGRVIEARIGIVVQFPQSFLPKLTARERKYDRPSEDSVSHGALPVSTVEPDYPPNTGAEDSVILYNLINQQGQVTAMRVLRDVEPLTAATLAASQQWRFVPGAEAGTNTDSAVALVVTFRHP